VSAIRGRLWWVLIAMAALLVAFGVGDVLGGVTVDPGIALAVVGLSPAGIEGQSAAGYRMWDFATRAAGADLVVIGVLLAVVLLIPYRAGERWAWWLTWVLPAWAIAAPALFLAFGTPPGQPPAPPMISGPILAAIAAGILIVDRRRFVSPAAETARRRRGVESWTGG
jgi:hypothetical protein